MTVRSAFKQVPNSILKSPFISKKQYKLVPDVLAVLNVPLAELVELSIVHIPRPPALLEFSGYSIFNLHLL